MNRWSRSAVAAAALLAATVVVLQVGWFAQVFGSPDPVETAWRDWIQFHRTGVRILTGEGEAIYPGAFLRDGRPEFADGYFFLYPPFFIWIALPLGYLGRMGAYLACMAAVSMSTVLATLGILRAMGVRGMRRWLGLLGTMASAPWNGAVILGHLSALLLLGPMAAMMGSVRQRPFLAGCGLSILLAKPNWGLPILGLLVLGRQWRVLGGALAGGVILVFASLPLGPGLWEAWIQSMIGYRTLITDATFPWKQATLFATLQSLLHRPGSDPLVWIPWLVVGVAGLGWLAGLWARCGPSADAFGRLLGVSLLGILALNPYAYFYDVLLVVPAAAVLWTRPESYRRPGLRRGAQAACSATYVWMYVQYFFLMEGGPSLTGFGLVAWFFFELGDLGATSFSTSKRPEGKY